MKFTDLLGNSTDDRDDTAPEATPEATRETGADATLTRPSDIPPLVEEQPVRFSRVPQPNMPPVPPYDDLLPTTAAAEQEGTAVESVAPPQPERVDDTDVAWPAPVANDDTDVVWPAPVANDDTDVVWPVLESEREAATMWAPPTIETVAPALAPETTTDLEPLPELLPDPPLEPPAAAVDPAPGPDPLGPAPTAASVFGGQRAVGFTDPAEPEADAEPNEDASRIARFDAIDDDLLPVARRRAKR